MHSKSSIISFFLVFAVFGFAQNQESKKDSLTILIGDSITEEWLTFNPDFFSENNYINRGSGGHTTTQMLKRFDKDVIDLHPETVVILGGINDFIEKFDSFDIDKTKSNISIMTEMADKHGIKVILCSILPVYEFSKRKNLKPAKQIEELNLWIENFAKDNNFKYVDYHSAMKDEKSGLKKEYSEDGVHPNKNGYLIMESILQKTINEISNQ